MTDEQFLARKFYVIEYTSSHWTTEDTEVVIAHALDKSDALMVCHLHMQVTMRNRYTTINDHYDPDEISYIIVSVDRLTDKHPLWQEFYYDWVEELDDHGLVYPVIWKKECLSPQKYIPFENRSSQFSIPILNCPIEYKLSSKT